MMPARNSCVRSSASWCGRPRPAISKAGGPIPSRSRPCAHCARVRRWRDRLRPALIRDGGRAGRPDHAVLRREQDAAARAVEPLYLRLPRAAARAPERGDPPRPQAVEHSRHAARRRAVPKIIVFGIAKATATPPLKRSRIHPPMGCSEAWRCSRSRLGGGFARGVTATVSLCRVPGRPGVGTKKPQPALRLKIQRWCSLRTRSGHRCGRRRSHLPQPRSSRSPRSCWCTSD